jgi:hypothetical protein
MVYEDQRKYEEEQEDESLLIGQASSWCTANTIFDYIDEKDEEEDKHRCFVDRQRLIERKEETNIEKSACFDT